MTRRDEIIAGIPTAEDLDLIAVDQTGGQAMTRDEARQSALNTLAEAEQARATWDDPDAIKVCPDLDQAIHDRDNAPERFAAARCCKCGEPVGEKYHVSHGFVTCDSCRNKEAAEFSTYPPANRSNWDE